MTKNSEEDFTPERHNELHNAIEEPTDKAVQPTETTSTSTEATPNAEAPVESNSISDEEPIRSEDQVVDTPISAEDIKANNSREGESDLSSMDGKEDSAEGDARMENGKIDESSTDLPNTDENADNAAEPKPSEAEASPGADGDADTHEPTTTPESVPQATATDGAKESEDGAEDDAAKPDGGEAEDNGAPTDDKSSEILATQESKYEDDFSETYDLSERGAVVTTTAADTPATAYGDDGPQDSKSPTPSNNAAVVPVPVPVQMSDGRSLVEERGELRGEDRNDEGQANEGEDSRGHGQWKSEEELFLQSSLMNQHAEKEALQTIINEKVKVQKDCDDLKVRYMTLEENSKEWEQKSDSLNQKCQEQDVRIKELETEEVRLKEFEQWGQDNEAKVKDLQYRLTTLAGMDADKDRRIEKLQQELQEARSRLDASDRQVANNNEAIAQHQQPAQQSKTCTIL